jgi:hypothetical protein
VSGTVSGATRPGKEESGRACPFVQLAGELARQTHGRRGPAPPVRGQLADEIQRERHRRARRAKGGGPLARAMRRASG